MKKEAQTLNFYKIHEKLRNLLGDPAQLHQTSPLAHCNSALEILIATILTQATTDKNALNAWISFKKVFPNPDSVLKTTEDSLMNTIYSAGLAGQKAKVIRNVLKIVREQFGEYSLENLRNDPALAWQFLTGLPGVGPKTAACTMLFGLGFPYFPVDVHIHRILTRLGWVSGKEELSKIQQRLSAEIPLGLHQDLHILLLNLGRKNCRPAKPNCLNCPLQGICCQVVRFT